MHGQRCVRNQRLTSARGLPLTSPRQAFGDLWPGETGHAPSLDTLTRLAEMYGCSVADLLADCSDYRHLDPAHEIRQRLTALPSAIGSSSVSMPLTRSGDSLGYGSIDHLTALADRLDEMDMDRLARIAAIWAQQLGPEMNRRSLLVKISAALSMAASNPALAMANGDDLGNSPRMARASFDVSGIWHSRYLYYSGARDYEAKGAIYVIVR